jgi:NAD(P)H dehydrogenase (quinone)
MGNIAGTVLDTTVDCTITGLAYRGVGQYHRATRIPTKGDITTMKRALLGLLPLATFVFCVSPVYAADPSVLVVYQSASGNTEKMAQAVVDGAKSISGVNVILKRTGDVAANELMSCDALIVGSPVYFGNMSGEIKTFFDNWLLKFDLWRDRKMRNKVGAAFATGGAVSNGKEVTMLSILAAMLVNQMIVVGGGGAFGASATTGPDSPGIDDKELAEARELGKRVAEVVAVYKRGTAK